MAVYGSIKDPMAAPGPYETLEPPKLVAIAIAPTLFTGIFDATSPPPP